MPSQLEIMTIVEELTVDSDEKNLHFSNFQEAREVAKQNLGSVVKRSETGNGFMVILKTNTANHANGNEHSQFEQQVTFLAEYKGYNSKNQDDDTPESFENEIRKLTNFGDRAKALEHIKYEVALEFALEHGATINSSKTDNAPITFPMDIGKITWFITISKLPNGSTHLEVNDLPF